MWRLRVCGVSAAPGRARLRRLSVVADDDAPRCSVQLRVAGRTFCTKTAESGPAPQFDEEFMLPENAQPTDVVRISVFHNHRSVLEDRRLLGATEIDVADLFRHPSRSLVIFDSRDRLVLDDGEQACEVHVKTQRPAEFDTWQEGRDVLSPTSGPRVLIITRGTRGDVQPFVALARGLANRLGWYVTICTELNCKPFIKANADVTDGAVKFVPSGGNTPARIGSVISRWAINSKSDLLQAMMLARSEMEFFDSAPAVVYWARRIRPHVLIYGFTMASVALLASELLHVPLVGFVLQPNVLPSAHTSAVQPLATPVLCPVDVFEEHITSHQLQSRLKWLQEAAPATGAVNRLRAHYGLPPLRCSSYEALLQRNMPIVIPIHPKCYGPRPQDWPSNTVFTDFIFLRPGHELPPPWSPPLPPESELAVFIEGAKVSKVPLVLMAFSSMPIPRGTILEMAARIAEQCPQAPRVIALVGQDPGSPLYKDLISKVEELKGNQRLLEVTSAPYEVVFPHMSCVIIHGGLGTTAEAICAGVPIVVTGVLLMDQRFWGKRVAQLGIGPEPVHIDDFGPICVTQVAQCLSDSFQQRAKALALAIHRDPADDGVEGNVRAVQRMVLEHPVSWVTPPETMSLCGCSPTSRTCGIS